MTEGMISAQLHLQYIDEGPFYLSRILREQKIPMVTSELSNKRGLSKTAHICLCRKTSLLFTNDPN